MMWGFWILTEIFIYILHQTYWGIKTIINLVTQIKQQKVELPKQLEVELANKSSSLGVNHAKSWSADTTKKSGNDSVQMLVEDIDDNGLFKKPK
jgi:hypothetical protein